MHGTSVPYAPAGEDKLLRKAERTWMFGLVVLAALAVGNHLVTDTLIFRQADTARIVNLSGRQRMLSQRIVKIALERASHVIPGTDARAQQVMRESIDRMSLVHNGLLHGSAELKLRPPPPEVREVYLGPQQLDTRVERFLLHARRLADRSRQELTLDDPDLRQIEEDSRTPLLNGLDAAVAANQEYAERSIDSLRRLLAELTGATLVVLVLEALFLYRPLLRRLAISHRALVDAGRTDPLTGCGNRRAFDEALVAATDRALRAGENLSLLSLDLDHFKSVNDRFGHAAGDLVLQTTVRTLQNVMRTSDTLCRVGGEEFVILLPRANQEEALTTARRLLARIADAPVPLPHLNLQVTASMGAATLNVNNDSPKELIARADAALYRAKSSGRNRVESEARPSPTASSGCGNGETVTPAKAPAFAA